MTILFFQKNSIIFWLGFIIFMDISNANIFFWKFVQKLWIRSTPPPGWDKIPTFPEKIPLGYSTIRGLKDIIYRTRMVFSLGCIVEFSVGVHLAGVWTPVLWSRPYSSLAMCHGSRLKCELRSPDPIATLTPTLTNPVVAHADKVWQMS